VNLPLKIKYQQKLELRIFRQELRYGYRFFGGSDFESFLGEEMNQEESFLFLKIIYALTFNKNLFLPFSSSFGCLVLYPLLSNLLFFTVLHGTRRVTFLEFIGHPQWSP
jgi:hypothetical protein